MRIFIPILVVFSCSGIYAQDDLLEEINSEEETTIVIGTFNGSRVINGQSVDGMGKSELEFIFSHRFGALNSGAYNLWGLDDAFIRLGLEYGITDRLSMSVGRSSTDKTYDGFFRYKILQQSKGKRNMPITLSGVVSGYIKTSPKKEDNPDVALNDRLAYATELLLARKFSSRISAQLTPIFVHRNMVDQTFENNNDYALGFSAKVRITKSLSLLGEYFVRLNAHENSPYYDPVGFGLDIETGGHIFQLLFTNSRNMVDRSVITQTDGNFFDGDIHFGFNISRSFQLGKRK